MSVCVNAFCVVVMVVMVLVMMMRKNLLFVVLCWVGITIFPMGLSHTSCKKQKKEKEEKEKKVSKKETFLCMGAQVIHLVLLLNPLGHWGPSDPLVFSRSSCQVLFGSVLSYFQESLLSVSFSLLLLTEELLTRVSYLSLQKKGQKKGQDCAFVCFYLCVFACVCVCVCVFSCLAVST